MAKILLAEDDLELAARLTEWLKFNKYTVEHVANGNDACQMLELSSFDLVVLDWDLPGKSGVEVCANLRNKGGSTPVLMLTGKDESQDKIQALDSGADDYVTKPFNMGELGARLRALLRRGKVESSNRLLAALPEPERHRLYPHLEPVSLPLGKALYESGDRLRNVYFPTTAIFTRRFGWMIVSTSFFHCVSFDWGRASRKCTRPSSKN